MTANQQPLPGSEEAISLGCECPVYECEQGAHSAWRGFIVSQWCRVHVVDWDLPPNTLTREMVDHSTIYWYSRAVLAESTAEQVTQRTQLLEAVAVAAEARRKCEEGFLTSTDVDIDVLANYSILSDELEDALAALEMT